MYSIKGFLWCLAILTMLSGTRGSSIDTTYASSAAVAARPFPQHTVYHPGTILPNHISRNVMDDSVRSFYRSWKKRYIVPSCTQGEAYVWFEGSSKSDNICVSEGQGYGMIIVALMAGFDSTAQETFDALYRFYKSHPAASNPHLMAWIQGKDCKSIDGGTATDGDMDIAYSLLLADAQWGRHSNIPYKQEALATIAAIKHEEINPITYIVMEANEESPHSRDYYDMRSSDFMPDHIRAFRAATGDSTWDSVLTNNYRLFHYLQDTYSPEAGLVPDFIKQVSLRPGQGFAGNLPTSAQGAGSADADDPTMETISAVPAQPNYLESKYDGLYNFNACRVPWRISSDLLVSGDRRAADFLAPINAWIRTTTKGNPDNISAGYDLSGTDLPHRYFEALCFICPFAVSAMAGGPENQEWLNKLWDYITRFKLKDFDYYDNSIKMINLIILSGNYWAPINEPANHSAVLH
ncbi:MAG TPA: glycosyl hydrolase family 8 [Puia sp.]|uniref:glycosyl hydrolase family 8 n=1 Tax=Puia sp. TaxID=2045100 RepID=UPI002BD5B07D|nr:glycosyl hydrolase family 8 [Puia sp.]HVU96998.1 glycosyl hydrolase family 8 [Puia sp.]